MASLRWAWFKTGWLEVTFWRDCVGKVVCVCRKRNAIHLLVAGQGVAETTLIALQSNLDEEPPASLVTWF